MRILASLLAAAGLPGVSTDSFPVVQLDLFRAMMGSSAEAAPTEDNDMADIGGVLKYIHTELLTEHLANPLRKHRKYSIDSIRKQRFKIRNPDALLNSTPFPDFGPFITYDWGEATNKAQLPILEKYGDFVGIQSGCANGLCDPRYPANEPYNWYSVGNWCPSLPFDKKGSKENPNPMCPKHNGKYLLGGLCAEGDDHVNAVPLMEPTGVPGCVYSYGRPMLVLLDELTGITREDCAGGVKCRDWLHFRNNCTNKEYRRQFDPADGTLKSTDFCVEYDIHPQCEANCHVPACRSLHASGRTVEVGLPFWRGRCDPGANQRRLEVAAASFGIAGALDAHQSVDPSVVGLNAPCVHKHSPNCKPGNGTGGPYCTRSMTGVCEICYVPGTKVGPIPTPKPLCPFDILKTVDYQDSAAIPPPVCKSKRPRELCCLFTGSCAAPSVPPLDADGLALALAAGAAPFEAFLRRAVDHGMLRISALDSINLRRAAYSQWARYPTGTSLSELLAGIAAFLKDPPPELLPASTTLVTTTPGTYCFEEGVAFLPLDMEGVSVELAGSAWECQGRCARTEGCAHFSFSSLGGMGGECHLQDALAVRVPLSLGFTSGPFRCWESMGSQTKQALVVKEGETYVEKELSCLELHTSYEPVMFVLDPPPSLIGLTLEQSMVACEQYCAGVEGCEHFMLSGHLGPCTLAGTGASKVASPGTLAAIPPCGDEGSKHLLQKFMALPAEGVTPARSGPWRRAAAAVGGLLLVVGVAASAVRVSRRNEKKPYFSPLEAA